MRINRTRTSIAGATLLAGAVAAGVAVAGTAASTAADGDVASDATTVAGTLHPLNESGVTGKASVVVDGRKLHVRVDARRLAEGLPHAQHIHYGKRALNECPNVKQDANGDFRLTTAEGVPAYGPVRVSLTTKGDSTAESTLAVDRYPTAPDGKVRYERTVSTKRFIANGVRRGDAVVVLHGVDHNHNGTYDFKSAGRSELDASLPAEATDPASCAVLRVK